MAFQQLDLYKRFGQYDNVCYVTLVPNSGSFKKYGTHLTGDFFYAKEERQELQQRLDEDDQNDAHSNVKFIERLKGVSKQHQDELLEKGFPTEDILDVFSLPRKNVNDYVIEEIRSLPEPMVIKFDAQNFDVVKATLWLNKQRLKDGFQLTEFEIDQDIAYRVINNNGDIPKDLPTAAYDPKDTTKLKPLIRYKILHHHFLHRELTPEEDAEFKAMLGQRAKESVDVLLKELERSTERFKKVGIEYPEAIQSLQQLVAFFEPERLTHTKIPVWWNLERFLHIYMRHVAEVQVGERFEGKSRFQYKLKDIRKLIEIILERLSPEINRHFEQSPDKEFKKQGSMSIYYNGDYYALHIRADGLLLTFYKNS